MATDKEMIEEFINSGKVKKYPAVEDVYEPANPDTLIPTEGWGINYLGKRCYKYLDKWAIDAQDSSKFDYGK